MTDFGNWCGPATVTSINGHQACVLVSKDDEAGINTVGATLATKYANVDTLAHIAEKFGKPRVSDFLRNKVPATARGRSGDMGEILATAYLEEDCGYVVGPSRLVHRDHHEWAMRGDDALGAKFDDVSVVRIAKAEAKSGVRIGRTVVKQAREGLQREGGLPSPHSLTQFAERLRGTPNESLGDAVWKLQLFDDIRPDLVTHVMFLFTANDPHEHVKDDLTNCGGPMEQITITLRVNAHQEFIRKAYEMTLTDDA